MKIIESDIFGTTAILEEDEDLFKKLKGLADEYPVNFFNLINKKLNEKGFSFMIAKNEEEKKKKTSKTFVATVQIVIHPDENLENQDDALEWFSGLLSDNEKILDWGYLKVGSQFLYPQEKAISSDYKEGDFLGG